jgi:hypothetical protein
MSDIVAVLVVPAAGDPAGLLTTGRCDSVPPEVQSGHACGHAYHREWKPAGEMTDCYMCRHPASALPLWWDGSLVPEGWDRLNRALYRHKMAGRRSAESAEYAGIYGQLLVGKGDASRVVLLTRDAAGRLVEVTP